MQLHLQSDAIRRGLRTLIDLLLSGGLTGVVLGLSHLLGLHVTLEQFTTLLVTLTPILSAVKNALEDKTGKSFLVDKTRPSPDPVTQTTLPVVEGTDSTATEATLAASNPLADPIPPGPLDAPTTESVVFGQVPPGYLLLAVAPEDVDESDDVVGVTR